MLFTDIVQLLTGLQHKLEASARVRNFNFDKTTINMAFTAMIKVILTILTLANLALAASKRGLGADDGIPLSGFTGIGSKISWQYNWATTTTPKLDGLEYIPMLWSNKAELTSIWDTNAKYWLAHGSTTLLGFNEPDGCVNGLGSSCMSVAVAVPAFELWITPYAGTATIGAPAITNSNLAGQGVDWLNSFLSLANGAAGLDFLVMHWYGDAADLAGFKSQVTSLCNIVTKNNIPGGLWITEVRNSLFFVLSSFPSQNDFRAA